MFIKEILCSAIYMLQTISILLMVSNKNSIPKGAVFSFGIVSGDLKGVSENISVDRFLSWYFVPVVLRRSENKNKR